MGDPASMALMAGMMGSSLLGGITAPEGQELTSFEGMPGADPGEMFGETKGLLSNYLNAMIADAGRPVKLNTTVAPLPVFKGGALPTSISAGAVDPNRYSPSLRETPGVAIAPTALSAVDASASPRRRTLNGNISGGGSGNTDPRNGPIDARDPANHGTTPPGSRRLGDPTSSTGRPGNNLLPVGDTGPGGRVEVSDDQASAAAELLASLGGEGGGDDVFNIPDVSSLGGPQRRRLTA